MIISREIDFTTGLLQTPYCPRDVVGSEVFIPGTEPTRECDRHLGFPYDTTGGRLPPELRPDTGRVDSLHIH